MEKAYKYLKILLLVLCFVALLLGASRLYEHLSSQVQTQALATVPAQDSVTVPAGEEQQTEIAETEAADAENSSMAAPDFTVFDREGNAHKLSDFRGKPVILNFWASWCGPCQMEMPDFEETYRQYGDRIQFVMVNLTDGSQETVETASAFIENAGYSFPVYYDTAMEAAAAYGVNAVPVTYLIDAEGTLLAWGQGALSAEALQTAVNMLLDM